MVSKGAATVVVTGSPILSCLPTTGTAGTKWLLLHPVVARQPAEAPRKDIHPLPPGKPRDPPVNLLASVPAVLHGQTQGWDPEEKAGVEPEILPGKNLLCH